MDFWQRGTTVVGAVGTTSGYVADRWQGYRGGYASGMTMTRQASGLTGFQYCARVQRDSGNTSTAARFFTQGFESITSIPLAGQTVTLSFYARAGANYSPTSSRLVAQLVQGTGTDQTVSNGLTGQSDVISQFANLTTTWQRFSFTGSVATTSTQVAIILIDTPTGTAGANDWFEVTGVQLEAGSVATPFVRDGGTLQGELAACQRYYYRTGGVDSALLSGSGMGQSTTTAIFPVQMPVSMRVRPTSLEYSGVWLYDGSNTLNPTSYALAGGLVATPQMALVQATATSGITQFRPYVMYGTGSTSFIAFNAEL
jgi:hypothetical protein